MKIERLHNNGLSMVELVIAMAILVIGVLPIFHLMMQTRIGVENRHTDISGYLAAQTLLESVRARKWDENTVNGYTATRTDAKALKAEGESMEQWDDVDDFNGHEDTPEPHYTRKVLVEYVNVSNSGVVTKAGPNTETDHKLIEVSVDWRKGKPQKFVVRTVMSNL